MASHPEIVVGAPDDDLAASVRARDPRAVYFKQRQTLSVHVAAGDPPPATWAEAVLDGIIAARVGNPVTPEEGSR